MSSSIGSIGSSYSTTMQSMRTKMANNLFSKLDTSGQGYLTKIDLQAALDKVSSSSASSSTTSSVDDLFSKLDTDSDGKVTQQEFSDTLQKVAEQLDNQAMSMRMNGGMQGMGGMPPPPPPQDGDSGFTKDELTSQLSEIGSSDSKRSAAISNIVKNFDKADTDGDGKVSFKEAMAFDQSTSSSSSSTSSSTSTDASSSTSSSDLNAKLLSQIMKLMQAYGLGNDETRNSLLSTLSVTA
ncbi:EF-hand domain-containing protein [Sulfuritalea hydrogenivorans]|uniref:Calcium-binding EF-hand n=1 Tax=Sulfuritalea hydrogenivorans sk43H TaxID=1223802 RepID=W0SC53_9PROT|nr:EF-hand domain-containing protein [Sulfuritalea hydrogenivorans]BAO28310.1 calcium-binding EF-hand [Sulfuritalea hydrogenivorans sk43H]